MTLFDLSSWLPTVHAEVVVEEVKVVETPVVVVEEEEEEEPEDHMPAVLEVCEEMPDCVGLKHHLEECTARVESGSSETCVEEFFHLMHCVNHHAVPKIFAPLK
ncbi:ubiquinol-cytochrome C reductase hinge domain-containing protein [Syncephalis fuscata]|nr:ubiquinol-cytochrome C reductase hinge domain-containing protein [Syncephalis fuscata]